MGCNKKGFVGTFVKFGKYLYEQQYRGADKSLARPTSRCISFDD